MADTSLPDHLPNLRPDRQPPHPSWLPKQRRGTTPQMIGRYPDFDVLETADSWDDATRKVVLARLEPPGPLRFFTAEEEPCLRAFCDTVLAQDDEPRVPVAESVDSKLADGRLDGYQYADMPDDRDTWRLVLRGLDQTAARRYGAARSPPPSPPPAKRSSTSSRRASWWAGRGSAERQARLVGGDAHDAVRVLLPPVGMERDRLRRVPPTRAGSCGWAVPPGRPRRASRSRPAVPPTRIPSESCKRVRSDGRLLARRAQGSGRTEATTTPDSCSTCIPATCPARRPCAATARTTRSTWSSSAPARAARCSRSGWRAPGWRVVILEAGPFWHPDEDWVSDEAGSHALYWTQKRMIGGDDPIELGKNNSGRGVGGSMVHYAGYTPRFHPSDFPPSPTMGSARTGRSATPTCCPTTSGSSGSCRWPARTGRGAIRIATRSPRTPSPVLPRSCGGARCSVRHRDAGRAGRHRQRHLRQPPALHLPRLLPAGLQGQRQGQPVRHAPARRAGPRRGDPRRLHGRARRDRRRHRRRPRRRLLRRGRAEPSGCSGPRSSRSPGTRSKRRGCC